MRGRALRGLIWLTVLATSAAAQDSALTVTLEPPDQVVRGRPTFVIAVVDVPTDLPVLITPTSEGSALEVVRGRLLRADAEEPTARPLRIRIPLVARNAGTGIVRVHVASFRCDEHDQCVPIEAEATVTLQVRPEG